MIAFFKRNDISPVIALVLTTAVVRFHALSHPPHIDTIPFFHQSFLSQWNGLLSFYKSWPTLTIFLSIILQLIFSLYFNYCINQERLFSRKSYIPALAYIIFTSWMPVLSVFSMVFVSNCILFVAFAKALTIYHLQDARKASFDLGILVALATLFYFPAFLASLLILLIILLLRPFILQEIVGFLIGIICVFYLAAGFIYVFGDLKYIIHHLNFHVELPLSVTSVKSTVVAAIFSIGVLVYGTFLINQRGEQKSMAVRKKWNAVFFYCLFGLIMGLFSSTFPSYTWLLALTPFSILLSQALQHKQEKYNTFTLYFLLGIILLTQWLLY